MTLRVDPERVGTTATAWDTRSLELTGARKLLAGLSGAGFTTAVRGPATAFTTAWAGLARTEATAAEAQADGLRETATLLLREDLVSGRSLIAFLAQLEETR